MLDNVDLRNYRELPGRDDAVLQQQSTLGYFLCFLHDRILLFDNEPDFGWGCECIRRGHQ